MPSKSISTTLVRLILFHLTKAHTSIWFDFVWWRHIQPPQFIPWSSYVEFWELFSSIWVKYFFMCVLMTFHLLSFHSVGFTFVHILQIQVAHS
jgi:hypothetical protein